MQVHIEKQVHIKGDIEKPKKIQHKATKVWHTLKNLNVQSRSKYLSLTTLEKNQKDVQNFKIESKIDEINFDFEPKVLPLREGHCSYFQSVLFKDCNQRSNFFNNRILNVWNSLSDESVAATTTNRFKKRLYDLL